MVKDMLNINVVTPWGSVLCLSLDVISTVQDLKYILAMEKNIPVDTQKFIYRGVPLHNDGLLFFSIMDINGPIPVIHLVIDDPMDI